VLLVVALLGCTPSAERVCAKRMRVSEDRFGKLDPVSHRKGFVHCVEVAEKEKRENLPRYKCRADCVLDHKHLEDVGECEAKCP
jgi:hypothetical protein